MGLSLRDALGGAAAIGSGFLGGMAANKQAQNAEEDRAWQREQRDRQRKQWAAEDEATAADKSANDKFNAVLAQRRKQYESQFGTQAQVQGTEAVPGTTTDYGADQGSAQNDAILARRGGVKAGVTTTAPSTSTTLKLGDGPAASYGEDQGSAQNDAIVARRAGVKADVATKESGGTALTLGGSEAKPAAPAAPAQPWTPSQRDLLDAHDARTAELFARGSYKQAWQEFARGEEARTKMRQAEVQKGLIDFKATGDPTGFFKNVYALVNDGQSIVGVQKAPPSATGSPTWTITRRDDKSGQTSALTVTADQIGELATWASDPKAGAEYALKAQLERMKADEEIRAKRVAGDEARKTEGVRHQGDMEEIEARTRGQIRADGARTAGDIRVVRERGAQDRQTNEAKDRADGPKADKEYLRSLQQERMSVEAEVKSKQAEVKSFESSGAYTKEDKSRLSDLRAELQAKQARLDEVTGEIKKARVRADPSRPSLESLDSAARPTNKPAIGSFYTK